MKLGSRVLFCCAFTAVGCAGGWSDRGNGEREDGGETGLAIRTAITDTESDVAYIQYAIERVACVEGEQIAPLRRTARADIRPTRLPGALTRMENGPLDGMSQHGFTDHFEVLPAGCYDVVAAPQTTGAAASAACGAARANRVEVRDGNTTEVFLLSQCRGAEVGAVDAVAAFNRPPQLVGLTFSPSKFISAGEAATVCVTATDPDGDQLEIEWEQVGGTRPAEGSIIAPQEGPAAPGEEGAAPGEAVPAPGEEGAAPGEPAPAPGEAAPAAGEERAAPAARAATVTECVQIRPNEVGDYLFEVRIYDMLRDENNRMTRFESWYQNNGSPNASNDSLRFPVYVLAAAAEPQQPAVGEQAEPQQPAEGEQAEPQQPAEGEQAEPEEQAEQEEQAGQEEQPQPDEGAPSDDRQ